MSYTDFISNLVNYVEDVSEAYKCEVRHIENYIDIGHWERTPKTYTDSESGETHQYISRHFEKDYDESFKDFKRCIIKQESGDSPIPINCCVSASLEASIRIKLGQISLFKKGCILRVISTIKTDSGTTLSVTMGHYKIADIKYEDRFSCVNIIAYDDIYDIESKTNIRYGDTAFEALKDMLETLLDETSVKQLISLKYDYDYIYKLKGKPKREILANLAGQDCCMCRINREGFIRFNPLQQSGFVIDNTIGTDDYAQYSINGEIDLSEEKYGTTVIDTLYNEEYEEVLEPVPYEEAEPPYFRTSGGFLTEYPLYMYKKVTVDDEFNNTTDITDEDGEPIIVTGNPNQAISENNPDEITHGAPFTYVPINNPLIKSMTEIKNKLDDDMLNAANTLEITPISLTTIGNPFYEIGYYLTLIIDGANSSRVPVGIDQLGNFIYQTDPQSLPIIVTNLTFDLSSGMRVTIECPPPQTLPKSPYELASEINESFENKLRELVSGDEAWLLSYTGGDSWQYQPIR